MDDLEIKIPAYDDISPYGGVNEYADLSGDYWQVIIEDFQYLFYKLEDRAFIFQGNLIRHTQLQRGGIQYRHNAFLELNEEKENDRN
jgi:hypothetical protein